ncbi:amino acid permease [Myxococcota bacterium]|nr:amino acid permease [Myxococcota bacterium]
MVADGAPTRDGAALPRTLSLTDGIAILVGTVVGVGIFKTPALVAKSATGAPELLALWVLGALISIAGALCYAELAVAYPHAGGEYHFLRRAFGRAVGFLFAWGRLSVIQTGAIAAVAFVLGDYMTTILPLGPASSAVWAALAVIALTATNRAGLGETKRLQKVLTGALFTALVAIATLALVHAFAPGEPASQRAPEDAPIGRAAPGALAMVFVLLTYGGWNEAAYLSAELVRVERTMRRLLVLGLVAVAAVYVAMNVAYVEVLGIGGMRASEAVAADLMLHTVGPAGAAVLSLVVVAASLSTLNAAIYTGARSTFALGSDFERLGALARFDHERLTPANALWTQGAVALVLVGFGAFARSGFELMVALTAPVFWLFFLLSGLSVIVLRTREPDLPRPVRVPFYPVTPLLFSGVCLFMLHASLVHAGPGALAGVALLAAGVPVLLWARRARPVIADAPVP